MKTYRYEIDIPKKLVKLERLSSIGGVESTSRLSFGFFERHSYPEEVQHRLGMVERGGVNGEYCLAFLAAMDDLLERGLIEGES